MELGIIGFPQSGKTTVFQAVTGGKGESARGDRAALGAVKVPDPRLDALGEMFKPKKVTPAEVTYRDIPGTAGLGQGKGIEGQFLNDLAQTDAIIHVVEAFRDEPEPARLKERIASMELELAFSDLMIIERRLQRIEASRKGSKGRDFDAVAKESQLLSRIKSGLETETPLRHQRLTPEEAAKLRNYQLLTAKPLIVVLNIGEGYLGEAERLEAAVREGEPPRRAVAVCGGLEAELARLKEDEAREFMEDAGIRESSLRRMIRLSYEALGLVTFLTAGGTNEARAWSVPAGSTAPQAASKIHSDMERGFIRAEVVTFDELMGAGGFVEARKRGVLRVEGKSYVVQDGDVITFLFNV